MKGPRYHKPIPRLHLVIPDAKCANATPETMQAQRPEDAAFFARFLLNGGVRIRDNWLVAFLVLTVAATLLGLALISAWKEIELKSLDAEGSAPAGLVAVQSLRRPVARVPRS